MFRRTSDTLLSSAVRCLLQEAVLAAELVLATLLETARVGDAGPATVARNAAGRLDTPGAGHVPGDTPWTRQAPGAMPYLICCTEVLMRPLDCRVALNMALCTPLCSWHQPPAWSFTVHPLAGSR